MHQLSQNYKDSQYQILKLISKSRDDISLNDFIIQKDSKNERMELAKYICQLAYVNSNIHQKLVQLNQFIINNEVCVFSVPLHFQKSDKIMIEKAFQNDRSKNIYSASSLFWCYPKYNDNDKIFQSMEDFTCDPLKFVIGFPLNNLPQNSNIEFELTFGNNKNIPLISINEQTQEQKYSIFKMMNLRPQSVKKTRNEAKVDYKRNSSPIQNINTPIYKSNQIMVQDNSDEQKRIVKKNDQNIVTNYNSLNLKSDLRNKIRNNQQSNLNQVPPKIPPFQHKNPLLDQRIYFQINQKQLTDSSDQLPEEDKNKINLKSEQQTKHCPKNEINQNNYSENKKQFLNQYKNPKVIVPSNKIWRSQSAKKQINYDFFKNIQEDFSSKKKKQNSIHNELLDNIILNTKTNEGNLIEQLKNEQNLFFGDKISELQEVIEMVEQKKQLDLQEIQQAQKIHDIFKIKNHTDKKIDQNPVSLIQYFAEPPNKNIPNTGLFKKNKFMTEEQLLENEKISTAKKQAQQRISIFNR